MSSQEKITQGPQTDFQLQPARIRRGKTKPVVPPGKIEPKRTDWKFSFKAASKQEGGLAGALRGVRKEGDSWGDPQDLPKAVQDAAKVPRAGEPQTPFGSSGAEPGLSPTELLSDGFCLIRQFCRCRSRYLSLYLQSIVPCFRSVYVPSCLRCCLNAWR